MPPIKRIAIVGSRDFPDLEMVRAFVRTIPRRHVIVSGGARGVDKAAEDEAKARGMEVISIPADWKAHGNGAGAIRNRTIVKAADEIFAFWDLKSPGTQHSFELAIKHNKPIKIFGPDGAEIPNPKLK